MRQHITTNWTAFQTQTQPTPPPTERYTTHSRIRGHHPAFEFWIHRLFAADRDAQWFYTVINPALPRMTTDVREVYRHFMDCCERAMSACDRAFPVKHPARYDARNGLGLIWMPAVKHDCIHFHGWIRVPHRDAASFVETTASVKDRLTTVTVPASVAAVLDTLRTPSPTRTHWKRFATDNIFLHHEDGVAVAETDQTLTHHTEYLRPVTVEQRLYEWTDAAPRWVFKRLLPSEEVA